MSTKESKEEKKAPKGVNVRIIRDNLLSGLVPGLKSFVRDLASAVAEKYSPKMICIVRSHLGMNHYSLERMRGRSPLKAINQVRKTIKMAPISESENVQQFPDYGYQAPYCDVKNRLSKAVDITLVEPSLNQVHKLPADWADVVDGVLAKHKSVIQPDPNHFPCHFVLKGMDKNIIDR